MIINIIIAPMINKAEEQSELDTLIKSLPLEERVPVAALKKLLDEREQIDKDQEKHIVEIKKKYQAKIQPLLQRASEIIQGGSLTLQEAQPAEPFMKGNEKVENYLKGKVIDGYWNAVFSNSALVDQITEKDEKALESLIDVQSLLQGQEGHEDIVLKFVFKDNIYFNEKSLVRKAHLQKGQPVGIEGDKITWKQNHCLTHNIKKVTNKKTGVKATVQGAKIQSFFDIFLDWTSQDKELDRVTGMMQEISNLLIMDSVDYFLGVINADERSEDDDQEQLEEEQGAGNN